MRCLWPVLMVGCLDEQPDMVVVTDALEASTRIDVRQLERPCLGNRSAFPIRVQLPVEPVWWQVDIGYGFGADLLWEPMVPDTSRRVQYDSELAHDPGVVEVYSQGGFITFPCGYGWEQGLTLIDGQTGPAGRYRLTYGVLEQ